MAERITIRQLRPAFRAFIEEIGGQVLRVPYGENELEGRYSLEHCFGARYRVVRYGARGEEYHPLGNETRPAREMYEALHFAMNALREARRIAAQIVAICPLCAQPVLEGQPTMNGRTMHETCYLARFERVHQEVVTDNPNMR